MRAHQDSYVRLDPSAVVLREAREAWEETHLAPGATRAHGAGDRARPEEPSTERTCFERDRDRIVHSAAFRRLAGKTQVVVYPRDHQRTRLSHAFEVAQVATSIARGVGANVTLADAIALGHDCGHGPGGSRVRGRVRPVPARRVRPRPVGGRRRPRTLSTCAARRWTASATTPGRGPRRAPSRARSSSWSDRIAYCAHDFEDAVAAGIVRAEDLPAEVADVCGRTRSDAARHVHPRGDGLDRTDRADRHGRAGRGGARGAAEVQLRPHLHPPGVQSRRRRR